MSSAGLPADPHSPSTVPELGKPTLRTRRPFLGRLMVGAAAGIALLLGALLLLGLFLDPIAKKFAERRLWERTGHPVQIGDLKVHLFTGRLEVRDIRMLNNPGFGDLPLLEIPRLSLQLDTRHSTATNLHFTSLELHLSRLSIVRDARGQLNVDQLEKELRARSKRHRDGEPWRFEFGGIDEMRLTLDRVLFLDQRKPGPPREMNLGVKDERVTQIKSEEDFGKWAGAFLFRLLVQESVGGGEKKGRGRWQLFLDGE